MFIIGDFLHETKIDGKINFEKFTTKSQQQILDPEKYDGIILKKFINKLYKEIDNPESSQQIQKYNSQSVQADVKDLNKIIIQGTALNSKYAILNLDQITAKVYVKNLSFRSTLKTFNESNIIDIQSSLNFDSPTNDKFLIHWPINTFTNGLIQQKFEPIVGDELVEFIQKRQTHPIYQTFKSYDNCVDECISILSSYFYIDNSKIKNWQFKYTIQNESSLQVKMLSSLYNVLSSEYSINPLSGDNNQIQLSSCIYNKITNLSGDQLSTNEIKTLKNSINESFSNVKKIKQSIPSFIENPSAQIDVQTSISQINAYAQNVNIFYQNISSTIYSYQFNKFLKIRPDICYNDPNNQEIKNISSFDDQHLPDMFCKKYNIDGIFPSFEIIINKLKNQLTTLLTNVSSNDVKSKLSLYSVGQGISFKNIIPKASSPDAEIKTNYSNHSVDSVILSSNITKPISYNGYLTFNNSSNQFLQYIGQVLFENNQWNDLKQKGTSFVKPQEIKQSYDSSPLFDSSYDSTITFWTKIKDNKVRFPLLSFYQNQQFRFSINNDSIRSIFRGNKTDNLNQKWAQKIYGETSQSKILGNSFLLQLQKDSEYYPWVFWTLKFDTSTSKYYTSDKKISTLPNYKDSITIKIDVYYYKRNNDGIFQIVKKSLNQYDLNNSKFMTETKSFDDYVYKPFQYVNKEINQLSGFNMMIGGQYYPNSNYQTSNQQRNKNFFNGSFRDVMIFKGHLMEVEQKNLFKLGILNQYQFPTQYDNESLADLIKSGKFFLGLISIYDSSNINIINCDTKYNGTTYSF